MIPEHMAMSRRGSQGINPWRFIIPGLAGLLILGATYFLAPPHWNKVSLIGVLALIELWQGVYGLATRRIEQRNGKILKVHQGGKAVFISVIHLFFAAVFIALAWAVWSGLFEK